MKSSLKLLVVDDNVEITKLITLYFSKNGYKVIAANTGIDGFNKIKENPDIDILLLDIMLPDATGLDILEQIREILKNTVIIMVTGVNDLDTVVSAMKLGADDYVVKPFRLSNLKEKIENAVFKKEVSEKKYLTASSALEMIHSMNGKTTDFLFVFEDSEEFNRFVYEIKKMDKLEIKDMKIGNDYEVRVIMR